MPKIELNGQDKFRYKISGMKIVDHGAGYDSSIIIFIFIKQNWEKTRSR